MTGRPPLAWASSEAGLAKTSSGRGRLGFHGMSGAQDDLGWHASKGLIVRDCWPSRAHSGDQLWPPYPWWRWVRGGRPSPVPLRLGNHRLEEVWEASDGPASAAYSPLPRTSLSASAAGNTIPDPPLEMLEASKREDSAETAEA